MEPAELLASGDRPDRGPDGSDGDRSRDHPQPGPSAVPGLPELSEQVRPVSLASERILTVPGPWGDVLPDGGIRRGAVVSVHGPGTTSIVFGLMAAATRAREWVAVLDEPTLAVPALVEAELVLGRLALVQRVPANRRATVLAALLEGMGMVVVGSRFAPRHRDFRRLSARARERGAILVAAGFEVDRAGLRLRVRSIGRRWEHGRLVGHDLAVEVEERGRMSRHRLRVA